MKKIIKRWLKENGINLKEKEDVKVKILVTSLYEHMMRDMREIVDKIEDKELQTPDDKYTKDVSEMVIRWIKDKQKEELL